MSRYCLCSAVVFCSVASCALAIEPIQSGDYLLTLGNSISLQSNDAIPGALNAAMMSPSVYSSASAPVKWGRLSRWNNGLATHYLTTDYSGNDTSFAGGKVTGTHSAYWNLLTGPTGSGVPAGKTWDYVTLQGWSADNSNVNNTTPAVDARTYAAYDNAADPGNFHKMVRRFDMIIRKAGAQTVLFARQPNNPSVSNMTTFQNDVNRIMSNYDSIGRELGAPVVPMAQVYYNVTANRPSGYNIDLLYSDTVHPSTNGRALYPYVFYATLAQGNVTNLKLNFAGFDDTAAGNTALDAVLEAQTKAVVDARTDWEPHATRSGSASATYDPTTHHISVTITGDVTGLRIGTPKVDATQATMLGNTVALAGQNPVQSDNELMAWYNAGNLTAGTYDLGQLAQSTTSVDDLFVTYTPTVGDPGIGTITAVPEPSSIALLALAGIGLMRRRPGSF